MVGLSVYLSVVSTGLSHSSARRRKSSECEDEERFLPSLTRYECMEAAPRCSHAGRNEKKKNWITVSLSVGSRPFVVPDAGTSPI
ncbi:uncharacterized protein V6R79_006540 [Siganus canaliculatus]